jgi:cardiolipin synthase
MAETITSADLRTPSRWKVLDLPNALSLARGLLALLVWPARNHIAAIAVLVVLAGLSDVTDGWLARRRGGHEGALAVGAARRVGAWLDPICDKVFMLSLVAALWLARGVPLFIAGLLFARDLLLLPTVAMRSALRSGSHVEYRARGLGKAATVAQYASVFVLLARPSLLLASACVTATLGVAAYVDYVASATPTHART